MGDDSHFGNFGQAATTREVVLKIGVKHRDPKATLLMLKEDFICASANIENLDPEADANAIVRERIDNAGLNRVMSNSFGFGGTNASLVMERV